MKLVPDKFMEQWTAEISGNSSDFDWDIGNTVKLSKHRVSMSEVHELVSNGPAFLGRIAEPVFDENRWLLAGQTNDGRRLVLIFTRRDGRIRPISCRAMRKNEEEHYEHEKRTKA